MDEHVVPPHLCSTVGMNSQKGREQMNEKRERGDNAVTTKVEHIVLQEGAYQSGADELCRRRQGHLEIINHQ